MERISELMAKHHALCDSAFLEAEGAVEQRAAGAVTAFESFARALLAHFHAEEDVLFPAATAAAPSAGGPVSVMLSEHAQMRAVLDDMRESLRDENTGNYGGLSEMLLALSQQHNFKEENILYPLCDRAVAADHGFMALLREILDEGAQP